MALVLLCGFAPPAQSPGGPKPGTVAPDFILPDLRGKPTRLQDFRGHILVLNFWAFWCDTWKEELPHLKELAGRQNEEGFRLVAISVDGARLSEFQSRTKGDVPFPVLLDGGGKTSRVYDILHVPTVVLLDEKGRVGEVWSGYPGNHVVLSEIRKLRNASRKGSDK